MEDVVVISTVEGVGAVAAREVVVAGVAVEVSLLVRQ